MSHGWLMTLNLANVIMAAAALFSLFWEPDRFRGNCDHGPGKRMSKNAMNGPSP
jgi:hypothetical protein